MSRIKLVFLLLLLNAGFSLSLVHISTGFALVGQNGAFFLYTERGKVPLCAEAEFLGTKQGKLWFRSGKLLLVFSPQGRLEHEEELAPLERDFACATSDFGEYCFSKKTRIEEIWGWRGFRGYVEVWRKQGGRLGFLGKFPFPHSLEKVQPMQEGFLLIGSPSQGEVSFNGVSSYSWAVYMVGFSGRNICNFTVEAAKMYALTSRKEIFIFYQKGQRGTIINLSPHTCKPKGKVKIFHLPGNSTAGLVETPKGPRLLFLTSKGRYVLLGEYFELLDKGKFENFPKLSKLKILSGFQAPGREILAFILEGEDTEGKKEYFLAKFEKLKPKLNQIPSPVVFPSASGEIIIKEEGDVEKGPALH